MYRSVRELERDELDELKDSYFYQLLENEQEVLADAEFPSDIPDEVIYSHFEGIMFAYSDFGCNIPLF